MRVCVSGASSVSSAPGREGREVGGAAPNCKDSVRKAAGSLGTDPPDAAAAIALTSESPGEAAAEHAGEPRASSVRKAAGRSAAHPLGRGSETAALAEGGRPSKPRPNPSGSRCEEAGGTDAPTAVGGNSRAPGSTPGAVGAARCWGDTLHHEAARDASPLPPTAPPPSPAAPPPSLALLPPAPAPAPRRRSPTPPPLPPLRRASSVRKAAGSASPLPKDDGGSANDGSADRAGGEAWVCSPGSCAPGSAPGGVGVAGCTPPCVYGSDAAASTGVLPRPEIPSIALSEVERESPVSARSSCVLHRRCQAQSGRRAARRATRRGEGFRRRRCHRARPPRRTRAGRRARQAPLPPRAGAGLAKGGVRRPWRGCQCRRGRGHRGGRRGHGPSAETGRQREQGRPDPLRRHSRRSRPGGGGDLARGVALAGIGIAADAGLRGGIGGGALDAVDRRVDRGRARNTGPRLGADGGRVRRFVHEPVGEGVLRRRQHRLAPAGREPARAIGPFGVPKRTHLACRWQGGRRVGETQKFGKAPRIPRSRSRSTSARTKS